MPGAGSRGAPRGFVVRESAIHGRGVFADRSFRRGDIGLAIDDSDPVLDRGRLTAEEQIFIDVYIAVDGTERTTWMKSPERFINHSCEPSTYVRTDLRTGVRRTWALRDLRRGDELTWDYALNIWEEWIEPIPCRCGARSCRGSIQGNFFTLPRELQRRYLPWLDEPFKRRFAEQLRSLSRTADPGRRRAGRGGTDRARPVQRILPVSRRRTSRR